MALTQGDNSDHTTTVPDTTNLAIASVNPTVNLSVNTNSSFLQKIGGFTSTNGAEISAFDSGSDRLFVVAVSIVEIYSVSNTGALTLTGSLTTGFTPPAGTQAIPNSVAVKNGIVAVAYAVQNTTTSAQQTGQVSFYNVAGKFLNSVAVGALPDMLTFTPDGKKVLVANEGEPNSYGQPNSVDPEGSVSIINISRGVANATVAQASFTSFNSQIATLKAAGVRITGPGSTVAQDLEPEYIAVSPDGQTARITLQENNAIAILDIASATITSIWPLGAKNHNLPGKGLDASDRDLTSSSGKINIQNWPIFGLYQPDAIASFTANGQTYYITANEGDSRDYTGFSEEIRVGAAGYVLDATVFPNAAILKNNANLGRLQLTNATGDTDKDGDFDRIEAFGARSFSIWDARGNQIFDSGDQLEQITATKVPTLFNSDGTVATFDSRSDNKGPEPEGVVIGVINNRTYAFIGLERTGDVIVYEVTNPQAPTFVEYINTPEDIAIEGLTFVSAADSPTGKPLLVTTNEVSKTVAMFEITPSVRISDIQGTAHISSLRNQTVSNVPGIVTVVKSNGFYLQDPNPDSDDRTSEGIFIFTSSAPTVQVGDSILVDGMVSEFRPGGASGANNLTTTQITSPTIVKLSSGNALPSATILGNGNRTIPRTVIDNDTTGNIETGTTTFDPAQDGIDFYESLEAMVVQVNNPVAVSQTNSFGEIWVLADNGANATKRTARGGIVISPNDFNPERIQIDDTLFTSGSSPQVNVGATLATITGVVDYSFNNYEVLPTSVSVTSNRLRREVTALTSTTDQLTVATYNVENLDPGDGATKFNNLANRIVNNLKSPDIISLEEIQDNNGPTNDRVVDASTTFQTLIRAITAAGGPTYQYRQINPVDDTNGGEPGGNIRVGFLFNPSRVSFVDRPGGTSTSSTTVSNISGVPTVSNSPGLIDPTNSAFTSSRKPLVGEFTFNGKTVYIIGNHFNSKGGDQPLYGPNQPPTLTSEVQRQQQATLVKNFVQSILAIDPNANVAVVGDLNDFEFSTPVSTLESAGLTSLIETLPRNERYTYNFQGNAQTLDHILVSSNLLNKLDGYDVVHVNSEFADQDSDHDPSVARFNLPRNIAGSDRLIGTNGNELIDGGSGNDYLDGKTSADILLGGDGDDTILGGLGSDTLSGGKDNDRLIGWGGGTREIDLLKGDQGADTYVLGDTSSVFYASSANGDYAVIASFQAQDKIELKGFANNYSLRSASAVSGKKSAVGIFTSNGTELIAVVEDGLKLKTNLASDTSFVFV
ncbi:choice-of-anchor I family protein [Nostoc sp. CHAB 5836]|uniref:choice-of-anchor I family protein n=1 Tax=Nostoc sp. CHAB 5836 TaxID=2780404 RepID=UPI001E3D0B40|nr:choice-of-anchor I family protein [Nostoc sp. CHAB 5836]MCC5613839.1 choice-of-anchor I family protein [Nostoc sp. CHAB 5836]